MAWCQSGHKSLSLTQPHDNVITWKHFPRHSPFVRGIRHNDVIMGAMASQITSLTIVYRTVYSGADQRKHQSSASLALVWGIHRWPVNSPHRWPVTRKIFPFCDVIMGGFPVQKASDAELWCFHWCASEQTVEQSRHRWFEKPPRSLWRYCNALRKISVTCHMSNCANTILCQSGLILDWCLR